MTVVTPPRLFQDLGITEPGEKWVVEGTLYGTVTAPREWGDYRDEMMQKMRWGENLEWRLQRTLEANVWAVEEYDMSGSWVVRGYIAVYVDDLLTSGKREHVEGFLKQFSETFTCSAPDWIEEGAKAVSFCGLEISKESGGYGCIRSPTRGPSWRRGALRAQGELRKWKLRRRTRRPRVSRA